MLKNSGIKPDDQPHHLREVTSMKAMVYKEYGPPDVLQLREVEKPIPKDNEVRIKIYATTVSAEDRNLEASHSQPYSGFPLESCLASENQSSILGFELAGVIEAIGTEVKRFKIGDQVYGFAGLRFGAYAEFKCVPEDKMIALKPDNMTFGEAATVPNGALTSLVFLSKKGKIQSGEKVLIYGASGSVGTAAVQLAKYYGAEVTAVCSTKNIELVQSLGPIRSLIIHKRILREMVSIMILFLTRSAKPLLPNVNVH
jgi:NADPH:quinone reductase-like Zn-dependent oxidoreductase